MEPEDFVKTLGEMAPTKSALMLAGCSKSLADSFLNDYICHQRKVPLGIETHGDPFLELINRWDLSDVEIGPLTFSATPELIGHNIHVGKLELDPLVYHDSDHCYRLLDHEVRERIFCEVAPDGSHLMDVLLIIADLYGKTASNVLDDDETLMRIKQECIKLLDDLKYAGFYTAMLGV